MTFILTDKNFVGLYRVVYRIRAKQFTYIKSIQINRFKPMLLYYLIAARNRNPFVSPFTVFQRRPRSVRVSVGFQQLIVYYKSL